MIFYSRAPEGSFRRHMSLSDSKVDGGELGGNETRAKSFSRKRMELRRVRSLSIEKSDADPLNSGRSASKKRSEEEKETIPFTEKALLPENDVGSSAAVAAPHSHGSVSVIGRRREMEDAVAVELGFLKSSTGGSYDFFGVYDGHGGRRVALECGEMLHKLLATSVKEDEDESGGEINWKKTVIAGFQRMDEEVNKSGAAVATMGSTAVVAMVSETEVVVANCGDSRAVLSRGSVAVQLSDDHKPDRADELERIEECGGKVINWNRERVLGVLATSRSIGDYYLKPFVIAEPEVRIVPRTEKDEFLILASDGLWDVVSNQLACQVVRRCLLGHIRRRHRPDNNNRAVEAAAVLVELAMGRGSLDNITVVVVPFKR